MILTKLNAPQLKLGGFATTQATC